MLKIPKEVDYGILILLMLMEEGENHLIAASEMAELTNLPHQQVAKLLKKLQKNDVVKSFRGPKGGYKLNVEPENLTLSEIYAFFFGSLSVTDCTNSDKHSATCRVKKTCRLVPHMVMLNEALEQAFSNITLSKISLKNKKINQHVIGV